MDEIPSNGDLTRICSIINITEGPWALCSPAMGRGQRGSLCPSRWGGRLQARQRLGHAKQLEAVGTGLESPHTLIAKPTISGIEGRRVSFPALSSTPPSHASCQGGWPGVPQPGGRTLRFGFRSWLHLSVYVSLCLWHNCWSACVVRLQGARGAQPLRNPVWREFMCVSCVVIRSDHATCRRGHAWATPPQAGTPPLLLSHLFLFLDFFPHFVEILLRSLFHWRCASSIRGSRKSLPVMGREKSHPQRMETSDLLHVWVHFESLQKVQEA